MSLDEREVVEKTSHYKEEKPAFGVDKKFPNLVGN